MKNNIAPEDRVESIPLDKLRLAHDNPRFGDNESSHEQKDILSNIVRTYGVDDVLGSIARNGYFNAEPLVCQKSEDGSYKVIEGNRRLSALLIITKNKIASDFSAKSDKYNKLWIESGSKSLNSIPCIVFDEENNDTLYAYLGVRHIASAKEWDSYAKATWLSKAISEHGFDIQKLSEMIGDTGDAVKKLVESYNVVEQLIRENKFNPENSKRSGRGSSSQYPFSWVYTLLSYRSAREALGLTKENLTTKDPIEDMNKLDMWEVVFNAMFGNSSKGKDSQLIDSRQLGTLAKIINDKKQYRYLKQGDKIDEIIQFTKPPEEQIESNLLEAQKLLRNVNTVLSENDKDFIKKVSADNLETAKEIVNISNKILNEFQRK